MHESTTPTRHGRWRPVHLVWILIALVVFSACASTLVDSEPADQAVLLTDADYRSGTAGSVRLETAAELELLAPVPASKVSVVDGVDSIGEVPSAERVDDALIVRTASLELEVADVAAILLSARDEIGQLGGYVAGSDEYDQGDRRWASVTYRVPVDRFTEALDALRGLSERVVRESTQSQEVTSSVVDLDARIANLRASEAALVEIMDRSGRMEDVLAVQMRLEDVRGQIERLEAQRSNLADQAALSTLSVTWFTPVAAVTVAQEGWDFGAEVDTALAQTVEALQGLASLGVWFGVVALPLLGLPLLLVGALFLWLRRRSRRGDDDATGGPGSSAVTAAPAE